MWLENIENQSTKGLMFFVDCSSVWRSGLHQPAAGGGGWRSLRDGGAPPGSGPGQSGGDAEGGASEDASPRPTGAAGPDSAAGRRVQPAGPERTPAQVRHTMTTSY